MNKTEICYNCGYELTDDEMQRGESICDNCNDPSNCVIN
jgi:hypothetical protein